MSKQPRPENAARSNLVAYLDDELDERTARAVEATLQSDPRIRAEAEALRRAWDLLDYLPKPEPTAAFTHRTLDRISALRPAIVARPARRGWRSWMLGIGWAAALLLATAGGYAAVQMLPRSDPPPAVEPLEQDPQLVRDVRVIDRFRQYEHVDNVEFLRALDQPGLFGEDALDY